MKKLLLSFICLLVLGLPALADIWSAPITKDALSVIGKNSTNIASVSDKKVNLNNLDWYFTVLGEGTKTWNKQFNAGYLFGSKNNPISSLSLTTTDLSQKNIAKIVLTISGSNADSAYELETVCGSFSKTESNLSGSAAHTYEYTPNVIGSNIAFNVRSTKTGTENKTGVKISKIEIEYTDGEAISKTEVVLYWPEFENNEVSMKVGDNILLAAACDHENQTDFIDEIVYTSENPNIADVSEDNILVAKAAGNVTITAFLPDTHATYSSNKLTLNVTVSEPEPTQVATPVAYVNGKVLKDEDVVYVNDELSFSCTTDGAVITYMLEDENGHDIMEDYDGNPVVLKSAGIYSLTAEANKDGLDKSDELKVIFSVNKRQAELSFSADNAVAYMDAADEFVAPELNNPLSLPVTYLSMDDDVASVDETTGVVTLVGEGTTQIYAIFEGTDEYEAIEEDPFYTLTVYANKPNTVVDYVLVTDPSEIVAGGKYLIAAATTDKLLSTTSSNKNNTNRKAVDFTIVNANHIVNLPETAQIVTLTASNVEGAFNLQCGENAYLGATGTSSSKNQLGTVVSSGDNTAVVISISDNGEAKIEFTKAGAVGKYLLFNGSTANNTLFNNYTTRHENEANYENLRLFREHEHLIPAAPVVYVNDEPVDESNKNVTIIVNDANETAKVRFEHPENHDIYFCRSSQNWDQIETEAYAAEDNVGESNIHEGYVKYDNSVIELRTASHTITVYAHDGVVKSPLRTISFAVATGVEDVTTDAADADVKYFNLQGVEVENPAEGIYIRVANGKAEKIVR